MPHITIKSEYFRPSRRRVLGSALVVAACFVVFFFVWLTAVRGQGTKALSEKYSDDYSVSTPIIEDGQTLSQTFSYDNDLLSLGLVFSFSADSGAQPTGQLDVVLTDAATGEVLAVSQGEMGNIIAGQYTGLGLSAPVAGTEGRQYLLTLTPHYTGEGRLALGCSAAPLDSTTLLTVNNALVNGTIALLITYRQIGGFLTKFYWAIALLLTLLAGATAWAVLGGMLSLHRATFVLVLLLGLCYSMVLPPYAAPDEQYHINQSFTLACRFANTISGDDWEMGNVPITTSFRRSHDYNALLMDENTTVFTWQEAAGQLFSLSPDSFDSHTAREEAQADTGNTMYLASAAAVFVGFVLHLGFVPVLFLGRLANLLLFAALAAWAVRRAPFGKRIFFAAALLPMTLHLAASFSRDGPLLGLCFAFTALCLDAAYGARPFTAKTLLPLLIAGVLLAPAKAVYLPLALLLFLVPAAKLGGATIARNLKLGFLALCLLVGLFANRAMLTSALGLGAAAEETDAAESTTVAEAAPAEAAPAEAAPTEAAPTETAPAEAAPTEAAPAEAAPAEAAPAEAAPVVFDPNDEAIARSYANGPVLSEEELASISQYTAQAFVQRLYYYAHGEANPDEADVAYWVDALAKGDATAVFLAQAFFFDAAHMEASYAATDNFFAAAARCMWNQDILPNAHHMYCVHYLSEGPDGERGFRYICEMQETAQMIALAGIQLGSGNTDVMPMGLPELRAQIDEARRLAEEQRAQSIADGADAICFTPAYVLRHPAQTVLLVVRSVMENSDHYIRGLVGGSLSYYTLELAWGWVLLLYFMLSFAAVADTTEQASPLAGRPRLAAGLIALLCCTLVVFGCISWTPTYYTTIYGLQGRYLLPILPLALVACTPRRLRIEGDSRPVLILGAVLVNVGVLLNCLISVIAR